MNKPEIERVKRIKTEAREIAAAAVFNAFSNLPERVKSWAQPELTMLSNELMRLTLLLHQDGQSSKIQTT